MSILNLLSKDPPPDPELTIRVERLRALVGGIINTLPLPAGFKMMGKAAVTHINESNVDYVLSESQLFLGAAYLECEHIKNGTPSESELRFPGIE